MSASGLVRLLLPDGEPVEGLEPQRATFELTEDWKLKARLTIPIPEDAGSFILGGFEVRRTHDGTRQAAELHSGWIHGGSIVKLDVIVLVTAEG